MTIHSIPTHTNVHLNPNTLPHPLSPGGKVGKGVGGQKLPVPNNEGYNDGSPAVLESFAGLMPSISDDDIDALIGMLTAKMNNVQGNASANAIKLTGDEQRGCLAVKEQKLKDSEKKIEQQANRSWFEKNWDAIKNAFQYIGSCLSIAAGACTSVFGGAGALLIAAGVIGLVSAINTSVTLITAAVSGTALGIFGAIFKAAYPHDPQLWANADTGFSIVLTVASIAIAVATVCVNPGVVADISDKIITLVTTLAMAAGDVVAGVLKFQGVQAGADAKKLKAQAALMQAESDEMSAVIDQLVELATQGSQAFAAELSSLVAAGNEKASTLSRVHFA